MYTCSGHNFREADSTYSLKMALGVSKIPTSLDSHVWSCFSKPILFLKSSFKHGLRQPKLVTTYDDFHIGNQLFSCAFHVNIFFFYQFLIVRGQRSILVIAYLFIFLNKEVCILYLSLKFSTSVSLVLHRVVFSYGG